MAAKVLIAGAIVVLLVIAGLDVVATICLLRTEQLSRFQKLAQGAFVWLLPVIGALLVLRLLAESDPDLVRQRWIPNNTVNSYVLQALGVEARVVDRAVGQEIEQFATDALTGHSGYSDSGGGIDAGHGPGH